MLKFDLQKPNDVVAFGRATIDLYANEIGPMEEAKTFSKYVGGSPANTAVAMARLGLKVGYIGKVSDDQFGRFIVRYLADQGVDTSHIETAAPGIRSGVTMGEIKEGSCNCFMYRTDCADLHIDCAQLDESYIASHKLLLISGTSLSHSPRGRLCSSPSPWQSGTVWLLPLTSTTVTEPGTMTTRPVSILPSPPSRLIWCWEPGKSLIRWKNFSTRATMMTTGVLTG